MPAKRTLSEADLTRLGRVVKVWQSSGRVWQRPRALLDLFPASGGSKVHQSAVKLGMLLSAAAASDALISGVFIVKKSARKGTSGHEYRMETPEQRAERLEVERKIAERRQYKREALKGKGVPKQVSCGVVAFLVSNVLVKPEGDALEGEAPGPRFRRCVFDVSTAARPGRRIRFEVELSADVLAEGQESMRRIIASEGARVLFEAALETIAARGDALDERSGPMSVERSLPLAARPGGV